jgi:hypothetical protein
VVGLLAENTGIFKTIKTKEIGVDFCTCLG